MSLIRNRLFQLRQELLNDSDRACYSNQNILKVVNLLIADLNIVSDRFDWILCSERMPEERDSIFAKKKGTKDWKTGMFEKISHDVLVTVRYDNGEVAVEYAHTVDGKWKLATQVIPKTVIAWQYFPEPYKEDENVSSM